MFHFKRIDETTRSTEGPDVMQITYEYAGPTEDNDPQDGQAISFDTERKDDHVIGKCSFVCEGRTTHIMHKYFEAEDFKYKKDIYSDLLVDAKMWFASHITLVHKISKEACETFVELAYINNYLQAIVDMKPNTMIHLDEGFYIEFFVVPSKDL